MTLAAGLAAGCGVSDPTEPPAPETAPVGDLGLPPDHQVGDILKPAPDSGGAADAENCGPPPARCCLQKPILWVSGFACQYVYCGLDKQMAPCSPEDGGAEGG
ncbi:MAG: hypothetical protein COU31_04940 [Candidatus Magasanikbacteria bacterium CG10_big_fil_rev_8_21_14_0_10_40_10]|uniref:Uncharacterized protein n=1 Tax=Candidatus Magasanikbacteria bacterium CG10_big_fil_rev_8_21_14_0_10_40_10 TaxID=1974648 RepID=A0A2M6W2Z5_9BACT|nr:MAG: hypothetical protein COU31_04940 [Candidatus Magasanikbacteria bacterium CG10_big_fil_rev_8_21_14_0_10_40_10]